MNLAVLNFQDCFTWASKGQCGDDLWLCSHVQGCQVAGVDDQVAVKVFKLQVGCLRDTFATCPSSRQNKAFHLLFSFIFIIQCAVAATAKWFGCCFWLWRKWLGLVIFLIGTLVGLGGSIACFFRLLRTLFSNLFQEEGGKRSSFKAGKRMGRVVDCCLIISMPKSVGVGPKWKCVDVWIPAPKNSWNFLKSEGDVS